MKYLYLLNNYKSEINNIKSCLYDELKTAFEVIGEKFDQWQELEEHFKNILHFKKTEESCKELLNKCNSYFELLKDKNRTALIADKKREDRFEKIREHQEQIKDCVEKIVKKEVKFKDSLKDGRAEQLTTLKDKYEEEVKAISEKLTEVFQESYEIVRWSFGRNKQKDIQKKFDMISKFINIDEAFTGLEDRCCEYNRRLEDTGKNKLQLQNNKNKISEYLGEIEQVIESFRQEIDYELDDIRSDIEECPEGKQEGSNIFSYLFQYLVKDLFEWIFIGKLKRADTLECTSDRSQIKDAVFKVEGGYTSDEDFGYPFQYLYLECKNYGEGKLTNKDLFQLFGYTLFLTDVGTFQNIPLCLLISRKNPDTNELIWSLRWDIFEKAGKRLILFLDDNDLSQMVENKCKNDNPAMVIKAKIKELQEYVMKSPRKFR